MKIEEVMRTVGDRIYKEYQKSGITNINAFACRCEVGYTTIWELISLHKPKPDIYLSTLLIIAENLGVSVGYLIGETEKGV